MGLGVRDGDRGRPSDLTPERHRLVVEELLAGRSWADVARLLGVAQVTVGRWIRKGTENPEGPYGEFSREAREAERQFDRENTEAIRRARDGENRERFVETITVRKEGREVEETVRERTTDIRPDWRAGAWMADRRQRPDVAIEVTESGGVDGGSGSGGETRIVVTHEGPGRSVRIPEERDPEKDGE